MSIQPVLLWSDLFIWLLVIAVTACGVWSARQPPVRSAWARVARNRTGMAAATLLTVFALVGLADSLHYRPQLPPKAGDAADTKPVYAVEVLSLLDFLVTPLRTRNEKTYSAPLATRAYAKEMIEVRGPDGVLRTQRDFPRLRHGGAHLGGDEGRAGSDIANRVLLALAVAGVVWAALAVLFTIGIARARQLATGDAWRALWRGGRVDDAPAWNAVLVTLGILCVLVALIAGPAGAYHVFGTDKVGQDVLYQVLKSIRTALVIGLVTTLVTLPLGVVLGIVAGYFRGWVDDVIQYLYTTLNSIPGVLLIAAAVLMMQVVIDTHPQWFATAAERADLRLLALCFILGLTSWTGLARLLRGEVMKLRELEYVQAAQAFGVSDLRIIARHLLPNVMHIVIIALVMDFSGLVLAEAVLSYVGIGVDPTMTSFGTMINNARMELGREPVVWWSLLAAFVFMFVLVLAANLLADAVRDAFDPRMS